MQGRIFLPPLIELRAKAFSGISRGFETDAGIIYANHFDDG